MQEFREQMRSLQEMVGDTRDAAVRTAAAVEAMDEKIDRMVDWKKGHGDHDNSVDARILVTSVQAKRNAEDIAALKGQRNWLVYGILGAVGASAVALVKTMWAWVHFTPPSGGTP